MAPRILERLKEKSEESSKRNVTYVRFSDETMRKLEKIQKKLSIENRSEIIRILIEEQLNNIDLEEKAKK